MYYLDKPHLTQESGGLVLKKLINFMNKKLREYDELKSKLEKLKEIQIDKIISIIPQPIINLFQFVFRSVSLTLNTNPNANRRSVSDELYREGIS